ncbi:glutamate decarboxylase [Frankia casuarinae]|uniref:Glutamate decarboxylase n=1 Tax=Frankia casuarinae (strain DSM 45818 / CECT 9043 / HFP020203 / CcI3) TaxID=106370 RepID=Q2JGL9_FRACC|nr:MULTISPECIES: glutamate decarboxylase [Frankia]ABD09573.1 glutamate decarboxylase [Frankia casuarinae]EYT93601.1 glutamate decarboxylase [Frankia casuarinae]KDA43821.1 glutamate decarboxylase [Frankia sp. BMG5.23]KEZ37289.1 glutamate decarboxylase [Frankia sp. CeD]TFE31167.1 glutamate decarboxylase [Frankia sp. B2]
MALHRQASGDRAEETVDVRPHLAPLGEEVVVPRFRMPQESTAPETAYQIVHDELMLDGKARLNMATFVTTWMDSYADRLMAECAPKNMIDKDEYPQTAALEERCVNILADLWHAPDAEHAVGCSTTGSSEACMLAGLAMIRRWRARRRSAGAPADRPNIVMGVNVQVCWEKFARYWDVEARLVPMAPGRTHLTADEAVAHCDENTIGVVAILGSTFDGSYEPVAGIVAALDHLAASGGPDVPVHVDAASGGFIAPFCDPDLVWDFQLDRVVSINTSGHKYGLVYPGVGWVLWRDRAHLPAELVFQVDYLGGTMPTFALNFSRPGAQVVAQYYTLLQLGYKGYRRVAQACRDNARWLAAEVAAMGPFELVSDGSGIPAFAFKLRDDITDYTVFDVSELLRTRGWLVPAYRFPPGLTDLAVLRVVVRHEFSRDLAGLLIADLRRVVNRLAHPGRRTAGDRPGESSFHH